MAQLESAYLTCVKSEFTLWPHKINKQANKNMCLWELLQVTAVAFLIKLVYCWTMAAWPFVCSPPPPEYPRLWGNSVCGESQEHFSLASGTFWWHWGFFSFSFLLTTSGTLPLFWSVNCLLSAWSSHLCNPGCRHICILDAVFFNPLRFEYTWRMYESWILSSP